MSFFDNYTNRAKVEAFDKMKKLWTDHWNKKKMVSQYGGSVPLEEDLKKLWEVIAILDVESDQMIARNRQRAIDDSGDGK